MNQTCLKKKDLREYGNQPNRDISSERMNLRGTSSQDPTTNDDSKFQNSNLANVKDSFIAEKAKVKAKGLSNNLQEKSDNSKQAEGKSTCKSIVEAFDFVERMPTMMVSKRPNAESAAFDLIRNLSMCWVIMAHQFSERITKNAAVLNIATALSTAKHDWVVTFIEHGFYAVDFFLFMGGYVAF